MFQHAPRLSPSRAISEGQSTHQSGLVLVCLSHGRRTISGLCFRYPSTSVMQLNTNTPQAGTLLRLLRNLITATLVIVVLQVLVIAGNRALASIIILFSVLIITVSSLVARALVKRGHMVAAIALTCGGMYTSSVVSVLADPRVMTVSVLSALLGAALAMPFTTTRQLRVVLIAGGITVIIIAICGLFVNLLNHNYTTASDISLLVAITLSASIALGWLLSFHRRLTNLVTDLSAARNSLEAQVVVRTQQLGDELTRARGLEAELRVARERLVNTLEDERRRIRRDLHDGLGPILASLTLKLDTARRVAKLEPADPDGLSHLLVDMKGQTQTAVGSVRQLIYGLRPAALDEMGLIGALDHHAQSLTSAGLGVTLKCEQAIPALSAALEVAIYRIALEAITNVQKHAQASRCLVEIAMRDEHNYEPLGPAADESDLANQRSFVTLTVQDDGIGISPAAKPGVGSSSMRERAAELGGALTVKRLDKGTLVSAEFPI